MTDGHGAHARSRGKFVDAQALLGPLALDALTEGRTACNAAHPFEPYRQTDLVKCGQIGATLFNLVDLIDAQAGGGGNIRLRFPNALAVIPDLFTQHSNLPNESMIFFIRSLGGLGGMVKPKEPCVTSPRSSRNLQLRILSMRIIALSGLRSWKRCLVSANFDGIQFMRMN
ncbi:hypothetical protein [Rhodoblastus acidophilus]|uniref:hypothetical protein n=1 Tax=Rhodoblastus acidophilus TaxID=1074 RepID=UPI001FCEB0B3|nr:hypothetical protein [Rhodoblastus acidophilus]